MNKDRANRSGSRLEGNTAGLLEDYEYIEIDPSWLMKPARILGQPCYRRQFKIGTDIYGKQRRVDFFVYHPSKWPDGLIIQCKWQAGSGSVEEKYPFEALSIDYSEIPALIILDGGGYSDEAKNWLTKYAEKEGTYLYRVLSMGEFQRFVAKEM